MNLRIGLGDLPLAAYRWPLEGKRAPKAVVQLVHSLSGHMGRYEEFAAFLNDYGYEVWGHDHPGHGKTGPELGRASGDAMSLLLGGISLVRDSIRAEHPDLPVFLFGHSIGSFLALRSLQLDKTGWDGVILSGTNDRNPLLLEETIVAVYPLLAHLKKSRAAERALTGMVVKRVESGLLYRGHSHWRTRDLMQETLYNSDPLCGFPVNHDFLKSLAKGLSYWFRKEELDKLSKALPVLIISGTDDPIGNYGKGAAKLAKSLTGSGLSRVYLRFYEGARHDLLWETSREETMYDILEFLKLAVREEE